jgi:ferredoxin-NADP reductase
MKAVISDKKEIAKGTLMVELEILGDEVEFKPGQFFMLELINPPYNDDKGSKRYFSIVNSPRKKGILVMVTRLSDSAFKKSLNELAIGTEVYVDNIAGNFTLPNDKKKPLVFIAGGVGITPFMSMLRYVNEEELDYEITLIYSNRNNESTAFFEELKEIGEKNKNIKVIFTMTDDANWNGDKRRIDAQFIKDYINNGNEYAFMTAGPPPMVKAVVEALEAAGVDENNIITENFAGY